MHLLNPWNTNWIECTEINCLLGFILAMTITLRFSIALTLIWIIPSWYKNYLNKKYEYYKNK